MSASTPAQPPGELPAGMGAPATRALMNAGYTRLAQFTIVTEAEIKQLHGVGPHAINKLKAALAAQSLSFALPERKQK